MKHHTIFQVGLSLFDEASLKEFNHEELQTMCVGRILKALYGDPTMQEISQEEIRESAERIAKICLVLALVPQRLEIPDI